jgi:hypothetical protein
MHAYDIIFTGIALDLVGAVVLAKGFMVKNPQRAYFEALTVVGANLHLLRSALIQRIEAQIGAAFLTGGFLLQIWGALSGGISANEPGVISTFPRALGLVCAAAGLAWLCLRLGGRHANSAFYPVLFSDSTFTAPLPSNQSKGWNIRMAEILGVRPQPGEPGVELYGRIERRRAELAAQYSGKLGADFVID